MRLSATTLRHALGVKALVLVAIGLGLVAMGLSRPAILDDPALTSELSRVSTDETIPFGERAQAWHEVRRALDGGRWARFDPGLAALILGATLLAVWALWRPRQWPIVVGPRPHVTLILGLVAVGGCWAGYIGDAVLAVAREKVPWFADSLGIPTMVANTLAPIVAIGLFALAVPVLILRFRTRPTFPPQGGVRRILIAGLIYGPLALVFGAAGLLIGAEEGGFVLQLPLLLMAYTIASLGLTLMSRPPRQGDAASPMASADQKGDV